MSLAVLGSILKKKPDAKKEIYETYDFFVQQSLGDFISFERIESFSETNEDLLTWILDAFVKGKVLKEADANFCAKCDSLLSILPELSRDCDICEKRILTKKNIVTRFGYLLSKKFDQRTPFLEEYKKTGQLACINKSWSNQGADLPGDIVFLVSDKNAI